MNFFNNLNGCELVTLANIISITLAQELSTEELISLAGFFTIIGDSLSALASSPNNNCSLNNNLE